MKTKEITIKIRVDEKNISKLYNNYDINYDSVEDFMTMLIQNIETPIEYLKDFGYDVFCMKNYYCENCGDDNLDIPIDDGTGSIFCSEYCIEKSLEWRSEDIKKLITKTK